MIQYASQSTQRLIDRIWEEGFWSYKPTFIKHLGRVERFLKREFALFISDADECNASVPLCDANANCQNTVGSFICTCKTGFTGDGFNCSGKKNMEETGCVGF